MRHVLAKRDMQLFISCGKGQCFHEASELPQGVCLQHFLGFTQALPFSLGHSRTYIPLGRDIYPMGKDQCLGEAKEVLMAKPEGVPRSHKTLAFPTGHKGLHIPLGRDISLFLGNSDLKLCRHMGL